MIFWFNLSSWNHEKGFPTQLRRGDFVDIASWWCLLCITLTTQLVLIFHFQLAPTSPLVIKMITKLIHIVTDTRMKAQPISTLRIIYQVYFCFTGIYLKPNYSTVTTITLSTITWNNLVCGTNSTSLYKRLLFASSALTVPNMSSRKETNSFFLFFVCSRLATEFLSTSTKEIAYSPYGKQCVLTAVNTKLYWRTALEHAKGWLMLSYLVRELHLQSLVNNTWQLLF